MKSHTKALNTKLQKLIADARETGLRPASDANRREFDSAMWLLFEFTMKYGDRLQVVDTEPAPSRAPERTAQP